MENCDLAEFNKHHQCFAVQCGNLKSCDVDSNGESMILTFSRKSGSDVWTRSKFLEFNEVRIQRRLIVDVDYLIREGRLFNFSQIDNAKN